jgi:thiol-disulfide isomerase/thioredoxin
MKPKNLIPLLIIVILVLGGVYFWNSSQNSNSSLPSLDEFAKCIADKKMTMYGAEWCPHCKKEKARFGDSWKFVPYVECPQNIDLCTAKKIQGYPTWEDENGNLYPGELGLGKIADLTGCNLPIEYR